MKHTAVLFAATVLATCQLYTVLGSSRLHETDLDLQKLFLTTDIPVDPSGKDGPKRVAGFFELNRTVSAEMFYFFFESRSDPANDPVVIWMTGGPGCSSELAVFYENGPFKINDDLTLRDNPDGWDIGHNMVYVDQPIGTGFSYSDSEEDRVTSEKGVADDMLDFLQEFLDAHPELADNDIYVTGESYAGHYVPAVSHRIWKYNKAPTGIPLKFKGLAIGNGLTDPAIQYGAYADYAAQNKLISKQFASAINAAYPACKSLIEACNHKTGCMKRAACVAANSYCQATVFGAVRLAAGNINVYDIRLQCQGALCYDFSKMGEYLAQPDVQEALGVVGKPWTECNSRVYGDFVADWMLDYATLLPEMLADGIRIMIYAGDKDLICNWLGNRRWVDAMEWEGSEVWAKAEDKPWTVNGAQAGTVAKAGPLSFVKVFNAGHMVPMDQGPASLDMLTHFTRNTDFDTAEASITDLTVADVISATARASSVLSSSE